MGRSKGRETSIKDNWKCVSICLAMALANCQYGYDTATIGGFQGKPNILCWTECFLKVFGYPDPERPIGYNIGTKPQQLITSFLNVGTIIGVLLTGPFAHFFGRKVGVWTACLVSCTACAIQIGTSNLAGLYAGRLLIGASNGFFITFANTYTAEASPAHLRGFIVSFFGIWVSVGSLLGTIADNYSKSLDSKLSYQIPLATIFAIPVMLSILIFFIPESPRWLLVHDRPEDARKSLLRLRGNSMSPELIEEEFVEMKRGIDEEKELGSSVSLLDLFRGPDLRRTLLCFGVILSHASSGIWLVIAYGTFFFQMAGVDNAFQASILSTAASFAGVLVGLYFVHKWIGRRFSMCLGSLGAGLCMLAVAISYHVAPNTKPAGKSLVAFIMIYGFVYNGFSGTLSWPVTTEVVSSRLRVMSIGFGTAINYFFSWLVSYTAPYFINKTELNWGPRYAYIWAGSNFATFLFFFFFLPEMKGRSLEELDELFQNRVSVKDFSKYQCVSSQRAREIVEQQIHGDEAHSKDGEVEVEHHEDAAGKV
ncbi:uncharacterized protein HMPREF1541_03306 [Cyphellophora europaea CBS 101466]|uniref:Major facilitator superfamily (MFS) profile domain-containing protein n=1 Tax=Cyphellophora europaea (strain CBS 101466) TaxID=1220924 RepID=W2RY10_CYPE1|nr:uncharacterized protein HMPREF1541_03306 [Cyphellophora europaea CBS 101466]ETN41371.1 hypothetical protein HMPREF1541_03306 [Cyphellophora europaea CBS 101466]